MCRRSSGASPKQNVRVMSAQNRLSACVGKMSTISDSPGRTGPVPSSCTNAPCGPGLVIGGSPSQPCARSVAITSARTRSAVSSSPSNTRPSPLDDDEPRISTTRAIAASVARCAARIPARACSSLARRRSWNCSRSGRTATPLLAQEVGRDDRERRRHDHLAQAEVADDPAQHLDLGVVPSHPSGDQLARAELGAQQHVGGPGVAAGGVGLDLAGHDQALTVRLDVDERVDDRDAGGEKQVGVAKGIGEHEQSCGHADKLSPARW